MLCRNRFGADEKRTGWSDRREEDRMATNNTNRGGDATTERTATRDTAQTAASTATSARVKGTGPTPRTAGGAGSTPPHVQPRRAERRPDMIRQRREARRQAYERQRRQWLLTRIGLIAFAVVVVVGVGYGVFRLVQDRAVNVVPEGTMNFSYQGNQHDTNPVQYTEVPPVGGVHDPVPQNCGYYDQPVRSENAVHSLEHGAVWITYQPELPQEQIDKLRAIADDESEILVSPFPGLPAPVVASSWNHQLQLESADDERLQQFIRRFRNSTDAPEPGAGCTGTGTPM